MKPLHLVIILAVPMSFIGGMGFTVLTLSHTPNPPSHVVTANNITMSSSNGSARAIVNPNTNRIYVANEIGHTVSVIDGNSNAKIAEIQVGVDPTGIAVNPATNRVFVTNYKSGTVSVIDGNNDALIGKPLFLDFGVEGIAVNPATNKTYVADGATTTLYVIGNNTQKVRKIGGLSAWNVAVNPATNRIYVPSYFFNNLSVIDGKYDNIMKVIPIGKYPDTMNLK